MTLWIARFILFVLTLEAGICVAFLADDWKPLREREDALFERVLTKQKEGKGSYLLEAEDGIARTRVVRPLQPGEAQPYFHVNIDEDSEYLLETIPPPPNYWFLLLNNVRQAGCPVAAIEYPLSWELTGDDVHQRSLFATIDRALANFELAVLTVDLQRLRNQSHPIPEYLRRSAIPTKNVHGEIGGLVRVNRVFAPPSTTLAPNQRFSFRIQESVEDVDPLFVRWGDYLIPSFPLAIAMAQNKVPPDQLKITIGKHIRLGEAGPLIPIDDIGQLSNSVKAIESMKYSGLPAREATIPSDLPKVKQTVGEDPPRIALFTNSQEFNPAPWGTNSRLQQLVSTFDVLPKPTGVELHQRLTVSGELALLAIVALLSTLLMGLAPLWRHILFFILSALLIALLLRLHLGSDRWIPMTPVIATSLAGWLLSSRIKRHLQMGEGQVEPPPQPA